MIQIPALTPDLMAALSMQIPGCDFGHNSQLDFLGHPSSCDVQAVPGNGKTTLLAAKLALLSRNWSSRNQGVCVISHTNAARFEVEEKLLNLPQASAFLAHPHFIGTVTAFVNQYLALPYLRGLGWSVRQIDDGAFAAEAMRRMNSKAHLVKRTKIQSGQFCREVERWVSLLELASDFDCVPNSAPSKLKVVKRDRQHGPTTDCGGELEELKASLVNSGLFRFADMVAIATKALDSTPTLALRLRQRFPLVLLDEAQDTNGPLLKLLDRIFGEGVAYQKLGDQNQTLYEDEKLGEGDYWSAGATVIPLVETRRFGSAIAQFASRLTARAKQEIVGLEDCPSHRSLILFDRQTILDVIPTFATEIRSHWGPSAQAGRSVWAVASRHSLYRQQGNWPKSLVDYHPCYRNENGSRQRANLLSRLMQRSSLVHAVGKPGNEVLDPFTTGLVSLLKLYDFRGDGGMPPTCQNVWRLLQRGAAPKALVVRKLFRDRILCSKAAWNATDWTTFSTDLCEALNLPALSGAAAERLSSYLAFSENEAVTVPTDTDRSTKEAVHSDVVVKLGSVHAVKGKTVDAILVLESEVWKDKIRLMDLATVLPHAFGLEDRDFSKNPAQLAAATNIFVAVTRPRQVLSLAVRKDATSPQMLASARTQGWKILDLTPKGTLFDFLN